jgi:hypothetical protein
VRTLLPINTALVLAATPVMAQENSQGDALKNDQAVQQSQDPQPTAQGTKSPKSLSTEEQSVYQAVEDVWRNPVDLQGNPIPETARQ